MVPRFVMGCLCFVNNCLMPSLCAAQNGLVTMLAWQMTKSEPCYVAHTETVSTSLALGLSIADVNKQLGDIAGVHYGPMVSSAVSVLRRMCVLLMLSQIADALSYFQAPLADDHVMSLP